MAQQVVKSTSGLLQRMQDAVAKGWHILASTELVYEGDLPTCFSQDAVSEDPTNTRVLVCAEPHDDHFHLTIWTLVKPELNTTATSLTSNVLATLQARVMDEQATVASVGSA